MIGDFSISYVVNAEKGAKFVYKLGWYQMIKRHENLLISHLTGVYSRSLHPSDPIWRSGSIHQWSRRRFIWFTPPSKTGVHWRHFTTNAGTQKIPWCWSRPSMAITHQSLACMRLMPGAQITIQLETGSASCSEWVPTRSVSTGFSRLLIYQGILMPWSSRHFGSNSWLPGAITLRWVRIVKDQMASA